MRGTSTSRIRRRFQRLFRIRGQVLHVLLTLSPLGASLRPVRLACLIHAASVHSEPGSNSPSLKSPMRRRSAPPPVDSIKIIKGFFSGRSPRDHSRGNHSILKKSCSLILRCSVSKEPADEPPIFVTPITLHRLSAFASDHGDFFHRFVGFPRIRRKWPRSELLDFLSFYEKKSMKPSERRLADAFTPEEARQMIKIPRISAIASHHIDFF